MPLHITKAYGHVDELPAQLRLMYWYCHSPTQPQLELVLDLIMGRNPPHQPTHPTGTFKALPDILGS